MRLERPMTTVGGWQDQAGGMYPGARLMIAGPGLHQRISLQPGCWAEERQSEFASLVVLYYTGIRRVVRDQVRQVVGRDLARGTACPQVLHSIKTLATEMAYTLEDGEWDRLGSLPGCHWELNQILDPNTTNTPINTPLEAVRPFIRGAKLAGAGGGFPILLARSPAAGLGIQMFLNHSAARTRGARYDWHIAWEGLRAGRN